VRANWRNPRPAGRPACSWQDELARQARGPDPTGIEEEGHALVVPGLALCHVGRDHRPLVVEGLQQVSQRLDVAADFLHGDDIEVQDDLGDPGQIAVVPLRRVVGPGRPLLGEPSERTQVLGRDEQVVVELLRRDRLYELSSQLGDLSLDILRRFLGDRCHPALHADRSLT
jgi:hypothetical protein